MKPRGLNPALAELIKGAGGADIGTQISALDGI